MYLKNKLIKILNYFADKISQRINHISDVDKAKDFIKNTLHTHLMFFSRDLLRNEELLLLALSKNYANIQFFPKKLRGQKEFMLKAVQIYGGSTYYMSNELQNDFDIALAALQTKDFSLSHYSERIIELLQNKERTQQIENLITFFNKEHLEQNLKTTKPSKTIKI